MTELEAKIKSAAQKYYSDGSSPYTDDEFDAMVEELRATDPNSELFKTGWGYNINIDSTPGAKVRHRYGSAGSLDKCRTWSELGKTLQKGPVDISLKLDGLSVVLYYYKNRLIQALTRGDGNIGIDITEKVLKIFPSTTPCSNVEFTGAVRGEILMSFESFERFKKIHSEAKNPRNSTAGIINGKDTIQDMPYLTLLVYTIVGDENIGDRLNESGESSAYTISAVRKRLRDMFGSERVVPHRSEVVINENKFLDTMNHFKDEWYGTYPADGLVLTYEYLPANYVEKYEVTYDAKAFKFKAEEKACRVVEIEWNMTKKRYAMPKIRIVPTEFSGTTVEFCTGYNAQFIKDNNIGPGSIITVEKRGEIIPNVNEVIDATGANLITHCPNCGRKLVWNGVHLQCKNSNCSNAIQQDTLVWMEHVAPKDGLGDTLKLKMLSMLVESGELNDFSVERIMESKLKLSNSTQLVKQNDFADMWTSLHSDPVKLVDAILALNVPRIGGITAIKLSEYPDLVNILCDIACEEATTLPLSVSVALSKAIGQANTQSIEDNLWKFSRLSYLKKRIVKTIKSEVKLKGKVAITGKLSVKRSDFENQLRSAGYIPGDISKDTKFLITDDPNSSSSKNKKADQWGIVKITEQEFRKQYM